jgi:hypothetical protein
MQRWVQQLVLNNFVAKNFMKFIDSSQKWEGTNENAFYVKDDRKTKDMAVKDYHFTPNFFYRLINIHWLEKRG